MIRSLKIEQQILTRPAAYGTAVKCRAVSAIRLKGKWLERAGFPPGQRVQLTLLSPGVIQLSTINAQPSSIS